MITLHSIITDLETVNQHILIVLDGLDEYPVLTGQDSSGLQQTSGRKDVLDMLEELRSNHSKFHTLVLSRDERPIYDTVCVKL